MSGWQVWQILCQVNGCHNVGFVLWCCILFADLKLYKYIFIVFVWFCYSVGCVVIWNGFGVMLVENICFVSLIFRYYEVKIILLARYLTMYLCISE